MNRRRKVVCIAWRHRSIYLCFFFLFLFCLLCKYHFYANHVCRQHNGFITQTEFHPSTLSPGARSPPFNVTEQIETKKGCEPKHDCDYSSNRSYFCVHTTPRPQGSQCSVRDHPLTPAAASHDTTRRSTRTTWISFFRVEQLATRLNKSANESTMYFKLAYTHHSPQNQP